MNKHEPCPFCGSDYNEVPQGCAYVKCLNCGAYGPSADTQPYSMTQRIIVIACAWDKWDERHEE